jgi:GAF domain-containing protein
MTLLLRGKPTTTAYAGVVALELDQVQYEDDDGPCLAAIRSRGTEHTPVEQETRWPEFTAAARARGVESVLSLALGNEEEVVGGLNLYSQSVPTYCDEAVGVASAFADQLGVAAATLTTYVDAVELSRQLQQAMESRAVIEQAKGILMASEHIDAQEAFDILVRASQNRNRKLRVIAADIVRRYTKRHRAD